MRGGPMIWLMTHRGKTWLSMVPDNVWEPGAAGVYDSIWKEVAA